MLSLSDINLSCAISTRLNSGVRPCKVLLDVRRPLYSLLPGQAKYIKLSWSFSHNPTAATSTTPTGLIRILLASGGNFLLPIVLSTAQLAISSQWPDSDIPQNLEQVKVIVNVVGASVTSIVAALNRWHLSRITGMLAAAEAEAAAMMRQVTVDVTETTALLGRQSGAHSKRMTSTQKERQVGVTFDAELMIDNIGLAEDQTQRFATSLPVTYHSGSFPT